MKNQVTDKGLSIRWKLLVGFLGIVVLAVAVILLSVSSIVENRIRNDINANFVDAGRTFERIQEVRFRQLRQTAILLAEAPSLKAAISTGDTTTINQKIRGEFRYLLDFDPIIPDSMITAEFYSNPDSTGLFLICDAAGRPLGQMATTGLPHYSIADRAGVAQALQGEIAPQTFIWEQDGQYHNVITVPIWAGNRLQGTLSYGFPMREIETEQLSRDIGMEVSYFVGNQLIATSFDNLGRASRGKLSKHIHNASYKVLNNSEATTVELEINGENWMVYVAPMHDNIASIKGITGFYAVAKSLSQELVPLNNLQFIIFGIGIAAIIGAIGISFWLTQRITKPISLLETGVKRVENEEFDQEVPVISNDELGHLTKTFNNLVRSLQERLLMLKFVSRATLDAIKENISNIEPGGERRDVTVLFSDIRGFTSWSEQRAPEEVIDMLNRLFSLQADLIQQFGGDIDKFVGDELVAVFQGEDRNKQAVNAAVKIQRELTQLFHKKEGEIAVGIGINSGEVVMGAMGSENRMDYTVLGNTVNLGARLCSAAKAEQILISNTVYRHLERKIPLTELERITVKGIKEPVVIYEVNWGVENVRQ